MQTACCGLLLEFWRQLAPDCPRCLPWHPHSAHAIKKGGCEFRIGKEMVVEEIGMAPGQSLDFGKRRINGRRSSNSKGNQLNCE
jgi:hypothetical protein